MRWLARLPEKLLDHAALGIILAVLVVVFNYFWAARRVGYWARMKHVMLSVYFWFRFKRSRAGLRIVTLDDYVALLERLRRELCGYCHTRSTLKIKIHVYTMQLPRDWPLWASEIYTTSGGKTALEQYFFNFYTFLENSRKSSRPVDVKRVIIIENESSPLGKEKLRQLTADVCDTYYERYIKMLHYDRTQALFFKHQRPWPGWLSDSVFYGIDHEDGTAEWLWGVTTSYRAGEDLLLLRIHRLSTKTLNSRLVLPWSATSLVQMLDAQIDDFCQLDSLRGADSEPVSALAPSSSKSSSTGVSNAPEKETITSLPTPKVTAKGKMAKGKS